MIINQNSVGTQVLIQGNIQINIVVHAGSDRPDVWEQSDKSAEDGVDQETQVIAAEMDNGEILEILAAKNDEKEQLEEKLQEIIRKFCGKKIESVHLESVYVSLAEQYERNGVNKPLINRLIGKASRVGQCGTWLEFWIPSDMSAHRLIHANFCRDRLCMVCAWRRSKKLYMQNRECFDKLISQGKFIFLTLTAKNVEGEKLRMEITKYSNAFRDMLKDKLVKKNLLGWMRSLEVTYNQENNTYHPHIHAILHVSSSYFKNGYLDQDRWRRLWEQYAGLDYYSQVEVHVVKKRGGQDMYQALAEASKYCVKFESLKGLSEEKYIEVIGILDQALLSRRLITYGGLWREARKDLHQKDDLEDYDLDEDEEIDPGYRLLYEWVFGKQEYQLKSVKKDWKEVRRVEDE